ncbi:hypothetical protein A5784_11705 [Mycobacterium sp. 852013-50091_SCH5140682]|nr:hypothetical protein A5784_11705 [Mycobacterium sp. 852013-50091_SCH5140682]
MDMFEALVDFGPSVPVRTQVMSIRRTKLHRHANALEVVYVLAGELHVKVSCEEFDLRAGDFVVLNRGDPHQLIGREDGAVTAIVHIDPAAYRSVDAGAEHLIFACESFDLARHRGQEAMLRGLLLDLIDGKSDGVRRAGELMELLCAGYSLENYYNRTATLSSAQRERFRAMLRFLREHAAQRDVLGLLADDQHYSKSYVSHYFKEASGIRFSDLLGYLRVAEAENLLLATDATMLEISAKCGFSDAKYFTRTFVDWFHLSPADYRRRYQPDTLCDSIFDVVDRSTTDTLVRRQRQQVASPATDGPRLSVTPLLLKNLGSRLDAFTAGGNAAVATQPAPRRPDNPTHLVPIRVTRADLDEGFLIEGLASFRQLAGQPCLVLEYSSVPATQELLAMILKRLDAASAGCPPIWLTYSTFHDRAGVDEVVATIRAEHGVTVQPIMMP